MAVRDERALFVSELDIFSAQHVRADFGDLWAWTVGTRVQLSMGLDGVLGFLQLTSKGMYTLLLVFLSLFLLISFQFTISLQIISTYHIVQI